MSVETRFSRVDQEINSPDEPWLVRESDAIPRDSGVNGVTRHEEAVKNRSILILP